MIRKDATDAHYVSVGRWCTMLGVLVSIGTAYLVMQFQSIMDYVQALFSFFIAPLFGTVLLGMLWKRATPAGGFWGLLAGTLSSIGMWAWVKLDPVGAAIHRAFAARQGHGREHVPRAVVVPHLRAGHGGGEPADHAQAGSGTGGLVYGCTEMPSEGDLPLMQRPIFWAAVVAVVFVALNIIFW